MSKTTRVQGSAKGACPQTATLSNFTIVAITMNESIWLHRTRLILYKKFPFNRRTNLSKLEEAQEGDVRNTDAKLIKSA